VDYASSGADTNGGTIYLMAYHDQKEVAMKVAEILSVYLHQTKEKFLAEKWCSPSAKEIMNDITLICDTDGNKTD
jgi:hypothetical protein